MVSIIMNALMNGGIKAKRVDFAWRGVTDLSLEEEIGVRLDEAFVHQVLSDVQGKVAPLWPLKDFVAVNPFSGMSGQRFLDANDWLTSVADGTRLMPVSFYYQRIKSGEISAEDLEVALKICKSEYPQRYHGQTVPRLIASVAVGTPVGDSKVSRRNHYTVAEAIDVRDNSAWSVRVTDAISTHCAAHYDEGQAIWPSPWKHLSLYEAWLESSVHNQRMRKWGLSDLGSFVSRLPRDPAAAIAYLLAWMEVPRQSASDWLACQLFAIAGWASYLKYRLRQGSDVSTPSNDLVGLLAIRLAYDVAIAQQFGMQKVAGLWPVDSSMSHDSDVSTASVGATTVRGASNVIAASAATPSVLYWLQVSAEMAYQRTLGSALVAQPSSAGHNARTEVRKAAQMVFCIDVRSELIRRHLESTSVDIATLGFAGFFGLPIAYRAIGESRSVSQCPVLLQPSLHVHETLPGSSGVSQARADLRSIRNLWKSFQSSAASCFSFVESTGLAYGFKLLGDALGITRVVSTGQYDGVAIGERSMLGPGIVSADPDAGNHLTPDQRADIAESILKNLGLTEKFARLVVLCGHACETVNNPYRAGLDCGACGGHSGEPNARVAAGLLNATEVRSRLTARGIVIPVDTWFIPAVHNTTTDRILFYDESNLPPSHHVELTQLRSRCDHAGQLARTERSVRMGLGSADQIVDRALAWSEVRPEWGLAGNAAFIVAPRSRTARLKLDGRTFMHSYEHHRDENGKVLELIMTAPMVVANWINLQYFASTVDNRAYGSGNKVLHNVVGQFGILEGNAGDLRAGLPWQSVHDGQRYQHEPLRLAVIIEAPLEAIGAVIDKHQTVADLVNHGWLNLMAIDHDRLHRYVARAQGQPGQWIAADQLWSQMAP